MTDEQKDRAPPRRAGDIGTLFEQAEVITEYTDRMALEDGIIFDVQELSKLSPSIKWGEGLFQYVTSNLCSKGYVKDGAQPSIPNFLDLFRNMSEHMKRKGPDHFYNATIEFPDGTKGEVYAVKNNSNRYTLLLPEEY